MKNWEGEYPSNYLLLKFYYHFIKCILNFTKLALKKYNKRKDESNNPKKYFNILNYYAAITI